MLDDPRVLEELQDKLPDLASRAVRRGGGFESLEGRSTDALRGDVRRYTEGAGLEPGLEAIVRRFARPVMLVQDGTVGPVPDEYTDSEVIRGHVDRALPVIEAAIPAVGRVDLVDHRQDFAGTGWVVAPGIVVTNGHVAGKFAHRRGDTFPFLPLRGGGAVGARLDWYREYDRGARRAQVVVEQVLWIAEPDDHDVAFLRLAEPQGSDEPWPTPLELMTSDDLEALHDDMTSVDDDATGPPWIVVIGYPARSPWNDPRDQQRIFDGIYGYKRVAPGQITALDMRGDLVHHDATTLGGNSGSVLVDLRTGKVAGLHFQGQERVRNDAVPAPTVGELLRRVEA